jgi:hypothetical protein
MTTQHWCILCQGQTPNGKYMPGLAKFGSLGLKMKCINGLDAWAQAGSGPMRPCAAARGSYQEGVHNFVYPSTYISIHLKKIQGPVQHVPCGLRRRLDSSRSSQSITIVTLSIALASSLRAHAANLGPIYIILRAHAANLAKGPVQHRFGPAWA